MSETVSSAKGSRRRKECIHNIDFDSHYFQFYFIVCKAKHKIGKRKKGARKRAKREGKKMSKEENFFLLLWLGGLRVSNVNSLRRGFHLLHSTLMLQLVFCY